MHTHTPEDTDLPPRPMGHGETMVHVFRSAAEQSVAEGNGEVTPGDRSPPPEIRARTSVVPPLQRRLFEAEGRPVRLGRYEVLRAVGSGGMGMVYEALHVDHGHRVALKTLRWMTASGLGRFKNEFRSLCGVAHPNLVSLYELGAEEGEWFFTMELVEGRSFVEHVQSERARDGWEYLGETFTEDMPSTDGVDLRPAEPAPAGPRPCFHEGRLRAALRQLVAAVDALHGLGKLHRDLNPGNVLVTREGRVVVIDFGLICDRHEQPGAPYDGACGTPAYMSPEQGAGRHPTPASDWYGVGVILFEALTGQLPFSGSAVRVLSNKRHQSAPAPSVLAQGIPIDLEDLCIALLHREPEQRPSGAEILRRLGVPARTGHASRALATRSAAEPTPFAGRRAELDALHAARRAVAPGHPVVAAVHGPPGVGKTRLVDHFAAELAEQEGAIVLRGACRERETIPHRALDALVDALAAHLARLPEADARAVLPPAARDLAAVFPIFEGVGAIECLPPRPGSIPPPSSPEGTAFRCLRVILARLAGTGLVVLVLDDAHLGDRAGAERLAELVGPVYGAPPPTGVLVLLTHAAGETERSLVLDALDRAGLDFHHVALGPLPPGDAEALARAVLPEEHAGQAAAIAAASEGCPLAVDELARRFVETGDVSLDEAIAARLDHLPEPVLLLAEVLAAARRPIPQGLLFTVYCDVAGLVSGPSGEGAPGGDAALALLSAARLARASGVHASDLVRIRDARTQRVVAARTPPVVARRIHMALARALAARHDADPAVTADHFERAGAPALLIEHLAAAAERARRAHDFDRAAHLLGRALASAPRGTDEARLLFEARAEALAASGRAVEAAEAYLASAAGANPADALDRQRRAAEHLLVAGHVDQGLSVLLPLLEAYGVRWPETPRGAFWTLAARMLELRLRGVRLPDAERPWPAPAPGAAARVEALWSAGKGLSTIDPVRSSLFLVEALLGAVRAGDAWHATRALAFVGTVLATQGGAWEVAKGHDLIEEAARFARRSEDPYLLGFSWFCSGIGRLAAGRFREALARADEGLALMEEAGMALAWERDVHRVLCLQVLFELGALRERARRAEAWLHEARARGDRTGEVQGALAASFARLASGDTVGARTAVRGAVGLTWHGGFGLPHQVALWIEVMSLLYDGDAAAARAHLLAAWPSLEGAQLLRIQLVRIEARLLRGLTAIALGRPDLLRHAETDASALTREKRPHAHAAAALLRAGIARSRGEIASAASKLDEAARTYASAEMLVHAATARRARGVLLGGPEGRALVQEADAVLTAEGVRDCARWAWMYTAVGR